MRILLITSLYPDSSVTKRTTCLHDMMKYLSKEHEIVCFKEEQISLTLKVPEFRGNNPSGREFLLKCTNCFRVWKTEKDNIKIYRFTGISYPFLKYHIRTGRNVFFRIMAKKMNRQLKRLHYKPDIIVAEMPTPSILNYIMYLRPICPRIAFCHRTDLDYLNSDIVGSKEATDNIRNMSIRFQAVYARSRAIYEALKAGGVNHLSTEIAYLGVPERENDRTSESFRRNKKPRLFSVLFAGALIPQKGVHTILNTLHRLRDKFPFVFYIVGAGKEEARLKEQVLWLGLQDKVTFTGTLSREEVYDYMSKADIFVMPSRHETFGLVYLEAMLHGCITIGSKKEGIDGVIIDGENGFLVEALDEESLAEAFDTIYRLDEKSYLRICLQAEETAKKHTLPYAAERYLHILCEHLQKGIF